MTGTFLTRETDFILCVGGLAFALLACTAGSRWRLRRVGRLMATRDLVWGMLAILATVAALHRWGCMLWLALTTHSPQPVAWGTLYLLESVGAAWVTWALWRTQRSGEARSHSLAVATLASALTAAFSFCGALVQGANTSNHLGPLAATVDAMGTTAAIVFAAAVHLHCSATQYGTSEDRHLDRHALALAPSLLILMGLGWILTETTTRHALVQVQGRVLELVSIAASAVRPAAEPLLALPPPREGESRGSAPQQDQDGRAARTRKEVKEMLEGIASTGSIPITFTILQPHEGGWAVLLRCGSPGVDGGTRGLTHTAFQDLLRQGAMILAEPPQATHWITGLVVLRSATQPVLAVLRADVDTTAWEQDRLRQRLGPLVVTLLLAAALVLFDIARRRNTLARETLVNLSVEQSILLNTIDTQIWYLKDPETYGAVNDAHAAFLGRPRAHVEDRAIFDLLAEADAAILIRGNRRAFDLREQVRDEEKITDSQGRTRILSIVRTPRLNLRREVEYVVCSAEDVTELRRTEELERQRAREMSTLLDSLPGYAFFKDAHSAYVTANEKFCRALGLERQSIAGRSDADLFPPREAAVYHEADQRILSGAEPSIEVEEEARQEDGRVTIVSTRKVPLTDEAGQVVGLIGLGLDITERKAAEAALRKAKEELELSNRQLEEAIARAHEMALRADAANAAKSQFLANMSHEIRTPLNGIIGMITLLLETSLTAEQNWHAEIVRSSAEGLLCLINEILDFSKIEAGRMELEQVEFDLRASLEDATDSLAMRAFVKGLEFACVVDPAVPQILVGDPVRLRQVVTNLADNAIKFTERGEILVRIHLVERTEERCRLRFEISDTGIGIPADRLDQLFVPFTQADGSVTRRFGGTGLGLSICRRLVDLMQGAIEVTSHDGHGSTFSFAIDLGCGPTVPAEMDAFPCIAGRPVLVLDDHAATRQVLTGMLQRWGCVPVEAESAAQGLEVLASRPVDVVLLDANLPRMGSRDVLARLEGTDTRVVLLTSLRSGSTGSAREARALRISKPPHTQHLRQALMRATGCTPPEDTSTRPQDRPQDRERAGRGRILVVEDNRTNQAVALAMLDNLGYPAEVANNGVEALRIMETLSFDLVLMDCQMPEMDGYETTRRLRQGGSTLPIVAMTAQAFEDDRRRCLEAGMDEYLSKPLRPRQLADVLERLLGAAPRDACEPPPLPEPSSDSAFDASALLQRLAGDADIAAAIAQGFLEDIPHQLELLEQAQASGDVETARRIAHTIKGAASNIGSGALQEAAREVERLSEGNRPAETRKAMQRLSEVFAVVREAITAWLQLQGQQEMGP